MAFNTSFTYGFNLESFVNDLLADTSFEDKDDCVSPFPTEILENAPAAIVCCHQRQKLFCTSCLTENCKFCAENFHMGHSMISKNQALSKAQFVRKCLLLEARNFIPEVDNAHKIIQEKMDALLRNSLDTCVGISAYVKRLSNMAKSQEKELYAQVKANKVSKEAILRQQLFLVRRIRKTAIQIPKTLTSQLNLTVAAQLIANDKGLSDLVKCRSDIKKLHEEMNVNDTTHSVKLSKDYPKTRDLKNDVYCTEYLPDGVCLFGLSRSPLEEVFCEQPEIIHALRQKGIL